MRISDWSSDVCSSDLNIWSAEADSRQLNRNDQIAAVQGRFVDSAKIARLGLDALGRLSRNNFRTQPQVGNIDGTRVPANGINIGKDGRGDVSGTTIGVRRSRKLRKRAENARRPLRPRGASVRAIQHRSGEHT